VPPPRPESTLSPFTRDVNPSPQRQRKNQQLPRPPLQPVAVLHQQQQQQQRHMQQSAVAATTATPVPTSAAAMTAVHSQITLSEPRPGQERAQNVYVDAPLPRHHNRASATNGSKVAGPAEADSSSAGPSSAAAAKVSHDASARTRSKATLPAPSVAEMPPPKKQLQESNSASTAPTTSTAEAAPPGSLPSREKGGPGLMTPPPLVSPVEEDSIICRRCGRCRCHACRAPRRLPERWLCDNSVHVSASSVVSCLSCMCAADAVLYHCGKDTLEDASTGNIKGGKWRWLCAAALSLVFPCLCCYLPLKGCQRVTEAAYAKATSNGCRCEENPGADRESGGDRSNNVITSIPTSPATALSTASSFSAASSPVRGGGGGGGVAAAAMAKKNGDSFEQRLLL